MKVAFELVGQMPLLMHQDDIIAADRLSFWRKAPENKNISQNGDDRSPAWTWQTYCYQDGNHLVMPSENIMVSLRQAGAQMMLKRQKTYKEITQSGLLIDSEYCQFLVDGKQLEWDRILDIKDKDFLSQCDAAREMGFRLWWKRARVGTSKHIRVRPRFDRWSVRGTIHVIAKEITYEALETIFSLAGRVGLGDWRPGCKTPGPFGMFQAKLKLA